ncbi:DUF4440 domain-containing protein [Mangrovimonas sp. ST2L15]|uniref:YybH family protein n=1 Tax=Mangrovimonas sp. ST2L15 TaxID=1645916 RepID=UPI0006B5AAD2|nr:nuclear transport factor 2 family protein [Mangrovimonas sp. ST2L15]
MKPIFFALVLLLTCQLGLAQTTNYNSDQEAILAVMKEQEKAWNQHDLEGFMEGYWKSDSLKFFGSQGIASGWQKTLDNYKKGYPTSKESGILHFVIKSISPIENESYYVMGEFHLKRDIGNADGVFLIIFKKINGQWRIIADLSC